MTSSPVDWTLCADKNSVTCRQPDTDDTADMSADERKSYRVKDFKKQRRLVNSTGIII